MRRHSTATLMGLTKKELVEYVRMAEHNQDAAEEALRQQAENVKDWLPVVRCENCQYSKPYERADGGSGCYCQHPNNVFRYGTNWERLFEPVKEGNDFCSYGERKTENG